jgi:type II secretory pathway pseudopilin PulG
VVNGRGAIMDASGATDLGEPARGADRRAACRRRGRGDAGVRRGWGVAGGFMLVDAIVGTVMLGIALAVMLGILARAIGSQQQGEQMQVAAMLLDEQLNLVLARGPDDYAKRFAAEGPCDPPFAGYRYRVEFSGGTGGEAYRVVATVLWSSGGRERSATCETLIAPRLGDEPDPARRPEETVSRDF